MSAPIASTSRPTLFRLLDRAPTPELDIEAQLPSPSPVWTHTPRTDSTDAVDDFFGASRRTPSLSGTRDSRHDDVRAPSLLDTDVESLPPPPYECSLDPPAYTRVSDQPTLAMYLFKFGFLFPLFWLAGAFILFSPLQAPEDWETSKPEYERQEIIESMRRTEVKWAKRCLFAFLLATVIIVGTVVLGLYAIRS